MDPVGKFIGEAQQALVRKQRIEAAAHDLLEAMRNALALLEDYEVRIDQEWGLGRPIEAIEADGHLPPEIVAARAAIAKAEGSAE